jgi:transcription initiation factor TFIID subunit 9B
VLNVIQYILSLATQVNATPLPAVPEVFGVRLPQPSDCLTSVDFDLIPNKPPPGVKLYDEEIEEIEESESEEEEEDDEEMEPAPIPHSTSMPPPSQPAGTPMAVDVVREDAPFPISAIATPSDMDMIGTPAAGAGQAEDGSEEEDGLFAGGDDEEEESDGMEEVQTTGPANGIKRKLVEEDDYD